MAPPLLPIRLHLLSVVLLTYLSTGLAAAQNIVPSVVGTFHGLVERTPEPSPWTNGHLGARMELTVAANKSYSGKIISLGTPLTFSGTIVETDTGTGSSTATISRGGLPALTVELNFTNDEVTGSISDTDGSSASLRGWRKVWNATTRPISTSLLGRFNFHVGSSLDDGGIGSGTGFGSFTVPVGGDVTVSGKLPDGSDFKTTTFVGPRGQVLIYQPLYTKPGSFIGVLGISDPPPAQSSRPVVENIDTMTWHKPDQRPTLDRYRPEGFKTECSVSGLLYLPPVPGDIAGALLDVPNNGNLFFSGAAAGSETSIDTYFTLTSAGAVSIGGANPAKTTLSVKPATGEYSGSFTLSDTDTYQQTGTDLDGNPIYKKVSRTVKFQGLIVDAGSSAYAAGFYLMPGMPSPLESPPVTLSNSPLYGGQAWIENYSGAPEATFFGFDVDAANIIEGETGWIRLSGPGILEENRTFTIQVLPGSASKADLSATQISVTIPAGQHTVGIRLPVVDDGLDEEQETFTLVLADGPGYDINVGFCKVFIDDDEEPVELHSELSPLIVPVEGALELSVEALGSDLRYQWQRNLTDIPGAQGNPLQLTNVQISQAGSYRVKVFNALNEETTEAVDIAVVDTRPRNLALAPGDIATLTARAAGITGGLSYQWVFSGQMVEDDTGPNPRISGAQTATLTIKNLTEADIGDYNCEVTQLSTANQLGTGQIQLRLPTAKPELADIDLPDGAILKPYRHEVLYDISHDRVPGGFTATGLPAGLSIDPTTGIISGTPTASVQDAPVTITATNPAGNTSLQTTLTVHAFPSGALGTFHGLVARVTSDTLVLSAPEWPRADLGARLELQTTATGAFSGKLLNGSAIAFSGQLAYDGNDLLSCSHIEVPMSGKNQPPCYLWLTFDPAKQTCTGRLSLLPAIAGSVPEVAALVCGWRNAWAKTSPATRYLGRYNFTLDDIQRIPQEAPAGTGYGTCAIPASGAFNISGLLSDGTAFICNTFLGPDGQLLLYQPLFKVPGSLIGAVQIHLMDDPDTPPNITLLITAPDNFRPLLPCTWNKPHQSDPKAKLYPRGFLPATLNVEGGLYTPPEPGAVVMDLYDVPQNAVLNFNSTDSAMEPQPLTLSSAGAATLPSGTEANPMKVSFTLNATTGQFSGAFTKLDEDPARPALYDDFTGRLIRPQGYFTRSGRFFGAIIQNPRLGSGPDSIMGRGFFLLPGLPDPTASPPITAANAQTLSSKLRLTANPDAQQPLIVSLGDGEPILSLEESSTTGLDFQIIDVRLSEPQPIRRTFTLTVRHLTTTASDFILGHKTIVFEPGETEAYTYIASEDDLLDEQDESFDIQLTDGPGYNVSPAKQRVVIYDDDTAAQFTTQPVSQLLTQGSPLTLEVEAIGSGNLTFQWRRDGVPIPGAIQPRIDLEIPQSGKYDVVVTNLIGTATSAAANVSLLDMADRYIPVSIGANATLPLKISAPAGAVTFQWIDLSTTLPISPATRISGIASQTLKINSITANDEADFACVVIKPAKSILVDGVPNEIEPEIKIQGPAFHLVIVNQPPELLEIPPLTEPPHSGVVARPFSYQVSFTPDTFRQPASFSASSLPAGLVIDPISGLISGIPTAAVTERSITITATNAAGSDSVTTTLTIEPLDASAIGTFQGLVDRNLGELISEDPPEYQTPWEGAELGALIEITTTSSSSYTGKLTYGTSTHNFTGSLTNIIDNPVSSSTLITRSGKMPLFLKFFIDGVTGGLQGELDASDLGSYSPTDVQAWKKTWSASKPATAYAGKYAFSILNATGDSNFAPGGAGFATCTVPTNGAPFIIKGRLIDGTAFTSSTTLGPRGEFIIYQSLYAKPGSVLGHLRLAAEPDAPAGEPVFVESDNASLFKPAQTSAAEIYRGGITPTTLTFEGGRALAPAAGQIVIGLPNVADNAYISFSGATVEYTETLPDTLFRIQPSGATVMHTGDENPGKTTVTVKPASSEFSGGFTLKDRNPLNEATYLTRRASFQGIFIQLSNGTQLGRGFFTLKELPVPPITTVATAPTFTGMVEIRPSQGAF